MVFLVFVSVNKIYMSVKYTFSGHESFPCKSLWLKKDMIL